MRSGRGWLDMSLLDAIVLGLIQGIAEFLPISSKGHLFLAQRCLGLTDSDQNLFFVVMLHQASLAAILVYYRRAIVMTIRSARREIVWVILGTIPAAAAGVWLKRELVYLYAQPLWTFAGFLATAAVLFGAARVRTGTRSLEAASWKEVLSVGLFQAAALLPGVSRSGMTVSAGLFAGLSPHEAVRFSFYLGGVAILGAGAVEIREVVETGLGAAPAVLAVGLAVTFVSSLAALWVVERVVNRGKLIFFSVYCAMLGVGGGAWIALRAL